ncbi:hypothetical protein JOC77_003533 [Peribacillus deserti]|uniref:DUF1541 domain-containing protein n=1 Tax=Peribacillus deserti TaxID=673318 RepID=A0ABS2QLN9_9BACI|nr:YdhK family protein [Peribacillus deserti]MBM7694089.1 hypothetical protein [Peribacillus deserti]
MKKQLAVLSTAIIFALSGCGNNTNHENENKDSSQEEMNHSDMNHSSSGEVPEGLKEAVNPAYEAGTKATVKSDHMEGMNGAEATISGAFDTTVYAISYTPATGGERVTNHKWVIHEEIKNARDKPYKSGEEVTLKADHMKGMKGAKAKIDSAQQTTVYMIDFTPTTGGEKVKNHKWVTESELSDSGH